MIKIYCTNWCGPCIAAKKMLDDMGITYKEINIDKEGLNRYDLAKLTGGSTVP